MRAPSSTYRIQFNKDFTFKDLLSIIDYLHALGISTIYASPILKSTRGSAHGYDVTDPHVLDPEIGTREELKSIAVRLKQRGMTWLQDIVPNHMAFDTSNTRLMDVLERGPASPYYSYFDVNWNHPSPDLTNRLMVPFLGNELNEVIKNGELKIIFSNAGFQVAYFDTRYPLSVKVYVQIFVMLNSPGALKLQHEWSTFLNGPAYASDLKTWTKLKSQLVSAIPNHELTAIDETLEILNGDTDRLLEVLKQQHYVLCHWKQTEKEINFRRFFTVNQLICLRMEDESVFQDYHSFLVSLYNDNLIQGFRIDHIDGLKDPELYIKNLRKLFGNACYIIAEKILESKEMMPLEWAIEGTSGYEFLAYVNRLFTDKKGAKQLLEYYRTIVPDVPRYHQLVLKNKRMMLENYMGGEWDNLVHYFVSLELQGDNDISKLKEAIGLLMVSLPVYRIYPTSIPLSDNDRAIIAEAFEKAYQLESACKDALDYLQSLFMSPSLTLAKNVLVFLQRMMQFTGPLTAKGVEDTTFYIYNPLISHDEVGDSPATLGITIQQFHKRMATRRENTPLSLNATATHDTKRGEDVRSRLNVLSEIPEIWQATVERWLLQSKSFFDSPDVKSKLSVNDEYFIYQSIVGGFPDDLLVTEAWINRVKEYLIKVVREAKVRSNWESPNEEYEKLCTQFIEHLLKEGSEFLIDAKSFVKKLLDSADTYSAAQVLIKITAPGIPDIYQGCELWDLSFVDPDNRRPVDYEVRKRFLDQLVRKEKEGNAALLAFISENRALGVEKLFVTWKTLNFRRNNEPLFKVGEYIPLKITGDNQLAAVYARHYNNEWLIVAVPFGLASHEKRNEILNPEEKEAVIMLEEFPTQWTNVFTGNVIASNGYLPLKEIIKDFPLGLLYAK